MKTTFCGSIWGDLGSFHVLKPRCEGEISHGGGTDYEPVPSGRMTTNRGVMRVRRNHHPSGVVKTAYPRNKRRKCCRSCTTYDDCMPRKTPQLESVAAVFPKPRIGGTGSLLFVSPFWFPSCGCSRFAPPSRFVRSLVVGSPRSFSGSVLVHMKATDHLDPLEMYLQALSVNTTYTSEGKVGEEGEGKSFHVDRLTDTMDPSKNPEETTNVEEGIYYPTTTREAAQTIDDEDQLAEDERMRNLKKQSGATSRDEIGYIFERQPANDDLKDDATTFGWLGGKKEPLLKVQDLHVEAVEDGQKILNGIDLTIYEGETHAIMGRNGSGKSTLSKVLAGHPNYKVTRGMVWFRGMNLMEMAIDHRAIAGFFLAFQYPIELPMIKNSEFLRIALNEKRRHLRLRPVSALEFNLLLHQQTPKVGLSDDFGGRAVNYGFSGGEKKRNEILQMLVLDPCFVMLDETDSGLDVDSFKRTAEAIQEFQVRSFSPALDFESPLDMGAGPRRLDPPSDGALENTTSPCGSCSKNQQTNVPSLKKKRKHTKGDDNAIWDTRSGKRRDGVELSDEEEDEGAGIDLMSGTKNVRPLAATATELLQKFGGKDITKGGLRRLKKTFMIVTHYRKLLDLLSPDYVHVMHAGRIVKTGGAMLAATLEQEGFGQFDGIQEEGDGNKEEGDVLLDDQAKREKSEISSVNDGWQKP